MLGSLKGESIMKNLITIVSLLIVGLLISPAQAATWQGYQMDGGVEALVAPQEYTLVEELNTDAGVFTLMDNGVVISVTDDYDIGCVSLFQSFSKKPTSAGCRVLVNGVVRIEGQAALAGKTFDTGAGSKTVSLSSGDVVTFEYKKNLPNRGKVTLTGSNINYHSFFVKTAN